MTVVRKGEKILESSEVKFMKLPSYVFHVYHAAEIRSELSITVLEKNKRLHKSTA